MHDVIDTEAEDLVSESYWPDSYKRIIREGIPPRFCAEYGKKSLFRGIYEKRFTHRFQNYDDFLAFLARAVAIGAENGSDGALALLSLAMRMGKALSVVLPLHTYLRPSVFPAEIQDEMSKIALEEFAKEHLLEHVHEDYYENTYESFDHFIGAMVDQLVVGAMNGSDDMLCRMLTAFALDLPLPPVRRYSKLLKRW